MKLISLNLIQFKGIKAFTLEPGGADLSVLGDNATGKTTLADAFFWLLFGKDSLGRADFSIKPLNAIGGEIRGTEPTVEAVLELPDGSKLTLKKVHSEKWQTKRGSLASEFTGYSVAHFINTVPVQAKEFNARIEGLCSEKLFRILTDPAHFSEGLHWKDRREMLLKICGDVTAAEVCEANPDLAELPAILGEHSIEEYRKVNAATRQQVRKEIDGIPARINEVQRQLDEIGTEPFDEAKASSLDQHLTSLQLKRAEMKTEGVKPQKQAALRSLYSEEDAIISRLKKAASAGHDEALAEIRKANGEVIEIQSKIDRKESQINTAKAQIPIIEGEIDTLRAEWNRINQREFIEPDISGVCPTCLQALPAEDLAAKRDEMLAAFNLKRSNDLEANVSAGKAKADLLKQRNAQITEAETELAALREELMAAERVLAAKQAAEREYRDPEIDPEHPELVSIRNQIKALEDQIAQIGDESAPDYTAIDAEIAQVKVDLDAENRKKAAAAIRKQSENRLNLLKQDEKRLAEEHTKLEGHFYLTEQFIRAKVSALTAKINSHFTLCSFKLFEEQVNGGLAECCEATCEGVPFSSLNNGRRVNVGLDIIGTLSHHFGFKPPIFIDNAESVTSIRPTPGQQQIRLVVSASDSALRPMTKTTTGVK